jgi:membrane dipeptidase
VPVDGRGRRIAFAVRFFDAHCDTILKIVENDADFTVPGAMHVTLPEMLQAGICAQVFAACITAEGWHGREDEIALRMVRAVASLCEQHPESMALVRTAADIEAACAGSGRIAAIPALEGADPLLGDPWALTAFHREGVRLLTLAWSDNAFCGTARGNATGLTRKGEDLVGLCEDLGVMVDVSHASDEAFWDVCAASTKPFVASHSNCRELCPSSRNLTDEMIKAIGERGGVVGVNLYSGFLSPEFSAQAEDYEQRAMSAVEAGETTFEEAGAAISAHLAAMPRPPLSLLVGHVRRIIRVGGEDCVGLGGDLDGIDSAPAEIGGVADYPKITRLLEEAGLSPEQIEKACHGNFERVFGEVLA